MKLKIFTALLGILLLAACGGNTNETETKKEEHPGQSVYRKNCATCHGSNGKMGLSGAKDLSLTKLSVEEMVPIITNGSSGGIMPGFKESLSAEEIKASAEYIETQLKN